MKKDGLVIVWRSADRLLVVGIVLLSVIWAVNALRRASHAQEAESDVAEAGLADIAPGAAAGSAVTTATHRAVSVPQGAGWIAYGGPSAARGDRRRQWSEQGVTRGEWLEAPAAPAVNIEQTADGYTVWCLLPDRSAGEIGLALAGDVLQVESLAGGPHRPPLRLRLPGVGSKRLTGSAVSNGWLRIAVRVE